MDSLYLPLGEEGKRPSGPVKTARAPIALVGKLHAIDAYAHRIGGFEGFDELMEADFGHTLDKGDRIHYDDLSRAKKTLMRQECSDNRTFELFAGRIHSICSNSIEHALRTYKNPRTRTTTVEIARVQDLNRLVGQMPMPRSTPWYAHARNLLMGAGGATLFALIADHEQLPISGIGFALFSGLGYLADYSQKSDAKRDLARASDLLNEAQYLDTQFKSLGVSQ